MLVALKIDEEVYVVETKRLPRIDEVFIPAVVEVLTTESLAQNTFFEITGKAAEINYRDKLIPAFHVSPWKTYDEVRQLDRRSANMELAPAILCMTVGGVVLMSMMTYANPGWFILIGVFIFAFGLLGVFWSQYSHRESRYYV